MKSSKQSFVRSVIALVLCVSMFVGTTFAWFTDEVVSMNNIIQTGILDVELEWFDEAAGAWKDVDQSTNVFSEDALWEPGYTEVVYLRIRNAGTLALKYQLGVRVASQTQGINIDDEQFLLSDYIHMGVATENIGENSFYATREAARAAITSSNTLTSGKTVHGEMLKDEADEYFALVVYMPESVGNEANYKVGTTQPTINLGITLLATQMTAESDSFGPDYDTNATFPVLKPGSVTVNVTTDAGNRLTEDVAMVNEEGTISAVVPAGTLLEPGTTSLTFSVSELSATASNVVLKENEILRSMDVHVEGVSADNDQPIEITVKEAAMPGLNVGNYALYHVENGATHEMTAGALNAHNGFAYDPATGDITLSMATFSPVLLVADTVNAWEGNVAEAFAGGNGTEKNPYHIANADQLAYLNKLVSDGTAQAGRFYKLLSDITFAGKTEDKSKVWYPIGYWKQGEGTNKAGETWYTYGGAFQGVFDGAGHKISGIYQNTWIMDGNYDNGYWKEAMGLFGYVYGGTVKNLTIDNFYSEGEFTPTGCVAAYAANATFENIAVIHSHPQTYNTSVAAVVGRDGKNGENNNIHANEKYNLIFRNITVDDTNTVSALWGSWDVGAAGLLGYLGSESKVLFENCNVAATIDVYNDVCGNYQYYWYRYCGAYIGTVDKRLDNGKGALDLSNVTAINCRVNFGDRHEYYYCEFEKNTVASYTDDFQFSRVDHSELNMDANPVTCTHTHTANEDKRAVYIPFRQLFGGYGWGVDGVDLGEYDGIDITDYTNAQEKFETKFTGDFLYRVGNQNAVSLGTLFAQHKDLNVEKLPILSSGVYVTVDKVDENMNVSGTFTANTSDWTKGTIQFSGTGVVKVTIQDYNFCKPTELYLEVVDAKNATAATSATKNNVVLLQDCNFSSLEVSGGYALYGNGFTMTCGSDSVAADMGYSFVTLNNGTLDNVQIVCPNFDFAALYKSQLTSDDNRKETDSAGKTRYYNAKSGVMVSGNSQILNSRISGGRAAVNVSGGNVVIDNSRIELGAVASILVGAANSLTLRDVTLVQEPTQSTCDSSKTLMGFSVLYMCDSEGNATATTLEGNLVQQAWIDADDAEYVPSAGKDIVTAVLEEEDYLHDIDGDGTDESLNLGFAYMPEELTGSVTKPTNITDNRTNKKTVPYEMKDVSVRLGIVSTTVYVYSYKNTNGTDNSFKDESEYVPNKYSDIITVAYTDIADGLTTGKSYGTDGWVYELNVDLDKLSGYALDFSKLSMIVNGVAVTDFKVNGSNKPGSPIAVVAGGTTYALTATIDGKDYTAYYKVTGTETSKESPSLVGTPSYGAGFGVANKYGGDWSAAAPVLDGITIKYWSVADSEYKEFALSSITFANTGKQNGTNNYWEYTHTNNDFTLKLTNTAVIHSNSGTYGMPVAGKDGKLYFTISSSGGFVSTGTTSRSITIAYEFTDNNGGDTLKFNHTWSISYSKDEQYNYSSFTSDGTLTKLESSSSSGGCVTPDTLITLANGSQVRVDSLKGDEMLLVWNLKTGKYEFAPIVFVDTEKESEYEIIHLYFSDGSDVKVISEHGFFDLDLGKYVYIDANNYADYIGHKFVAEGDIAANDWDVVTLDKVVIEKEVTTAWSPVTFEHLCYYTNGVLSMPGGIEGLFNIFEVDTDTMSYDAEQMQKDIETYGLFTVEDFGGMIPQAAFDAFNGAYLKVAIGKGLLTWEDIAYLAERYIPLM